MWHHHFLSVLIAPYLTVLCSLPHRQNCFKMHRQCGSLHMNTNNDIDTDTDLNTDKIFWTNWLPRCPNWIQFYNQNRFNSFIISSCFGSVIVQPMHAFKHSYNANCFWILDNPHLFWVCRLKCSDWYPYDLYIYTFSLLLKHILSHKDAVRVLLVATSFLRKPFADSDTSLMTPVLIFKLWS